MLVVPAGIFIAASYVFTTGTPVVVLSEPLFPQLIAFGAHLRFLCVAFAAAALDTIATLYLSTDVYYAWKGSPKRLKNIFGTFSVFAWLGYVISIAGWYALFTLFGLGIIGLSDLFITSLFAKLAVVIFFAAASFPVFYAGIVISAFALTLRADRGTPLSHTLRVMVDSLGSVYRFHAVRAVFDLGSTAVVPLLCAYLIPVRWVGFMITVASTGAFLTFTRVSSIAFKLDLMTEPVEASETRESAL